MVPMVWDVGVGVGVVPSGSYGLGKFQVIGLYQTRRKFRVMWWFRSVPGLEYNSWFGGGYGGYTVIFSNPGGVVLLSVVRYSMGWGRVGPRRPAMFLVCAWSLGAQLHLFGGVISLKGVWVVWGCPGMWQGDVGVGVGVIPSSSFGVWKF